MESEYEQLKFDFNRRRCSECKLCLTLDKFNKDWEVCKVCDKARKKERVIKARTYVIEYLKTHPCVDCGATNLVVLTFDHLRDKKYMISTLIRKGYSTDTIQEEIDKCEVRCANCHAIKTALQQNWNKIR
jgi:hypothetical protein